MERLCDAGLKISTEYWARYPIAERYYPHAISTDHVATFLSGGGLLLITGISGTGKTALLAESAVQAANEGRRTCWISLNDIVNPADAAELIADYCRASGFHDLCVKLRHCKSYEYAELLATIVADWPISIVFDRFETAGSRIVSLIKDVIQYLTQQTLSGSLVLTSQYVPEWWPDIERESDFAKSIPLGGLPAESAEILLCELGVGANQCERAELVESVGGHPQCLFVMEQVSSAVATKGLKGLEVEEARDWLLRHVVDELSPELKTGLAMLSIFGYPACLGEALAVIGKRGSDILRGLQRRELIKIRSETVTVHDALREVAVAVLSEIEVAEAHRAVADHLLRELKKIKEETAVLPYDTGIKWAAHLEAAARGGFITCEFEAVIRADVQRLRDLFGISTVGFPYEFKDPTLVATWSRVQTLIDEGLVNRLPHKEGEEDIPMPALVVIGFDKYQRFLAHCRCLLHGYSNHVGYFDDLRPNYSFEIQGLGCPWEHCIELQPLPPLNDEDHLAWVSSLEERILEAEHDADESYCDYLRECIADASSSESFADGGEGNSCPIFGHCCPGGRTQAQDCLLSEEDADDVVADNCLNDL